MTLLLVGWLHLIGDNPWTLLQLACMLLPFFEVVPRCRLLLVRCSSTILDCLLMAHKS
jgi:hypothetical protein